MTIELSDDERDALLVVLGMAAAVTMTRSGGGDEGIKAIRRLIGKVAPDSYWALAEEEKT